MKKRIHSTARKGFTVAEIMAVVIIIGLLASVAVVNFMGQVEKARVKTTQTSLKAISAAVKSFKMDTARYPSETEGLEVLLKGFAPTDVSGVNPDGYLDGLELPKDAWKNDFIYITETEDGYPFEIISYGADGTEGGEGFDADLSSLKTE